MKRTLKYFLVASLLTTGVLVSCGNENKSMVKANPTINELAQNETETPKKPYRYKEVGTKTETSLEVKCIVNLSDDLDGVYRLIHVEPGEKINIFGCVVSGYYGSVWYYDRYGLNEFDFENTPITENLTLYAYNIPRAGEPEIITPNEEGEFTITWENGTNSSIVSLDGQTLATKANKNDNIVFKLAFNYYADKNVEVKVNDKVITKDKNDIYSFKVTENATITVSNSKILDPIDLYTYTLKVGEKSYPMTKNPSNKLVYDVDGINLEKGDTFVVEQFDGAITKVFDKSIVTEDGNMKFVKFTCQEAGTYSISFDTTIKASRISGPVVEFTFTNSPEWILTEKPVIYAWNWVKDQEGSWKEVTFNKDGTLSIQLSKDTYGVKLLAFDKETFTQPNWDSKIGETPKDIILDPNNRSIDASKLWVYYFGESEISTFYFKAPTTWTEVKYYTWGAGSESDWPGSDMTLVDSEKNIYKAEIDTGKYVNIIFNNGSGTQTVDISLNGVSNNTLFELSTNNGEKYEVKQSIYQK